MVAREPTNMSLGLISVLEMWENGAVDKSNLAGRAAQDGGEIGRGTRGLHLDRRQCRGRKP